MMRHTHPPSRQRLLAQRTALIVLVALVGLAPQPVATAHEPTDTHNHLFIFLHEDYEASALGGGWEYRLEANATVAEDERGTHIRAQLPAPFTGLLGYAPAGDGQNGVATIERDEDGTGWAVFRWNEDADTPAPGTRLDHVLLEAFAEADPNADQAISWSGLLVHRPLMVRVSVPDDMTVSTQGQLVRQIHGNEAGRAEWFNTDFTADTLDVFARTESRDDDPAFAAPPNPYSHIVIVIGAGALAGLLWWWGFREDQRRAE